MLSKHIEKEAEYETMAKKKEAHTVNDAVKNEKITQRQFAIKTDVRPVLNEES